MVSDAGRLDHLDRRFDQPDLAARAGGIVAGEVLRPDAEDDAPAGLAERAARSAGSFNTVVPPPFGNAIAGTAIGGDDLGGRKFIAGEPMKPATNMLAGRS